MCGILLVQSQTNIPLEQHLAATELLASRGPDFTRYQYRNGIFIAQTVLHITGTADFYNQPKSDFLAYNGEIYNHRWFGGRDNNDVELVYSAVKDSLKKFRYFEGPWAWAYTDFSQVSYASDPQGERYLYRYQDNNILIVCSEVAPILTYIDAVKVDVPYANKTWTMQAETPWHGIERLEPGHLYTGRDKTYSIDNIWNWVSPAKYNSINEAQEEFDQLWDQTMQEQRPNTSVALSYSGGIDSSVILKSLPSPQLITIDMKGKDPVAANIHNAIGVDEQQYAKEYLDLLHRTQMPAQSWSFVGKWMVAKACNTRVLFTGLGADELFGGYGVYQTIDYDQKQSHSPYSEHGDPVIWQKCLEVYSGDARQATLLMDYWYQVIGCDAPGLDRIGGCWGIETRNPFLSRRIMQFALNLPWEYKVNTTTKPILRQRYFRDWGKEYVLPKQGFAGHANDALPWLGVDITPTGNRYDDWKQIARRTFYANDKSQGS